MTVLSQILFDGQNILPVDILIRNIIHHLFGHKDTQSADRALIGRKRDVRIRFFQRIIRDTAVDQGDLNAVKIDLRADLRLG